jgi:hypothetical protein
MSEDVVKLGSAVTTLGYYVVEALGPEFKMAATAYQTDIARLSHGDF